PLCGARKRRAAAPDGAGRRQPRTAHAHPGAVLADVLPGGVHPRVAAVRPTGQPQPVGRSVAEPPGRSRGRLRSRLPGVAPVAIGPGPGRGGGGGRLVLGVCAARGVRAVPTPGAARAALPGGLLLLGLPAAPADPAALRGGDRRPPLADAGEAGPHPGHHDGAAAVQLSPPGAAASTRCLAERPALPHLRGATIAAVDDGSAGTTTAAATPRAMSAQDEGASRRRRPAWPAAMVRPCAQPATGRSTRSTLRLVTTHHTICIEVRPSCSSAVHDPVPRKSPLTARCARPGASALVSSTWKDRRSPSTLRTSSTPLLPPPPAGTGWTTSAE